MRHSFSYYFCFMYACIVQYNKGFFMNFKRKILEILQNELSIYALFCCAPEAFALPVNHSKTINAMSLFRQNTNLLIRELPTIWHISLATYMRFISIEKVYLSILAKILKLFKPFDLIFIVLMVYLYIGVLFVYIFRQGF